MAAELHLAENALALHLLLQRLEGLVDIVVANENLHACSSFSSVHWNCIKAAKAQKACALPWRADVAEKGPVQSSANGVKG
jgi:hypothetical protein